MIINTIGPLWDGNEVWLLTAGGAMFAAFPNWYATLFSGFYLALFLMLVALIVRGGGVRIPQQGQESPLAHAVGLVHLRRQRDPGPAVGRGDGQHRARGADRREHAVRRRLLQPAESRMPCWAGWRGWGSSPCTARCSSACAPRTRCGAARKRWPTSCGL